MANNDTAHDEAESTVFISWSGDSSRIIAQELRKLLGNVFEESVLNKRVSFWMSGHDIKPGDRWRDELDKILENTNFAIICLVPTNLRAPWIHYEAGAILKAIGKSWVIPYCVGPCKVTEGPLSHIQATNKVEPLRNQTLKIIRSINDRLNLNIEINDLKSAFRELWPGVENRLEKTSVEVEDVRSEEFECIGVDGLLRRECLVSKEGPGELQSPSHIYVNSSQPIESKRDLYATQVMRNMRDGSKYNYVFKLHEFNGEHIAYMIVKLACVPQESKKNEHGNVPITYDNISKIISIVEGNITIINDHLRINMVKENYGFEYCILNANSETGDAHCYLRLTRVIETEKDRRWIHWGSGDIALKIATQVSDLCIDIEEEQARIIKSTKDFMIYNNKDLFGDFSKFANRLKAHIVDCLNKYIRDKVNQEVDEKLVKELATKLSNLCIGNSPSENSV